MLKRCHWLTLIGLLMLVNLFTAYAAPIAIPISKHQTITSNDTILKSETSPLRDVNLSDSEIIPRDSALPPGSQHLPTFVKLFQSKLVVHRDGSMTVTEAITINNRGRRRNQGVYREFPIRYITEKSGERKNVRFQLLATRLNGVPVPHFIENRGNSKRIFIGEKNKKLKSGIYTYTLSYKTSHQLKFSNDHERLSWNVTGSGWRYPIHEVSVSIKLPHGAAEHLKKIVAYTGLTGPSDSNIGRFTKHGDTIQFQVKKRLAPHDSLVLNLEWGKGFIISPLKFTLVNALFQKNIGTTSIGIGLLLLLIYYYVIWRWVGEGPSRKLITPQFTPPSNYSPALLRFIENMGYNNKVFIAALINMVVKGYINIAKGIRNYKVIQVSSNQDNLSRPEQEIANALFSKNNGEVSIHRDNRKRFQKSIHAFKRALRSEIEGAYFIRNTAYFILGVALSIAAIAPAIIINKTLLYIVVLYVVLLAVGLSAYYQRERAWRSWLFFIAVLTAEAMIIIPYRTTLLPLFEQHLMYWTAIVLITLINACFYHLIKKPTLKGRELLDQAEGFKQFLSAEENAYQQFQDPPKRDAQLFEQYFPYALALNVEKEWSTQFISILARDGSYCPNWYRGGTFENLGSPGYGLSFLNAFSKDFVKATGLNIS